MKNPFEVLLYILASDFSTKMINAYLKLEIRVVCREFLAFKYYFYVFYEHLKLILLGGFRTDS